MKWKHEIILRNRILKNLYNRMEIRHLRETINNEVEILKILSEVVILENRKEQMTEAWIGSEKVDRIELKILKPGEPYSDPDPYNRRVGINLKSGGYRNMYLTL